MMAICPECGKRHVVTWPELNPFRRGDEYYCSSNCYEVSVNRDLSKIKQVALNRRQRKNMKLKKDGTPAKKPGRKPQVKIETPEGEWTPAVDLNAPKKAEVPEKVPVVKVDGALKIETQEPEKVVVADTIEEAAQDNDLEMLAVRSKRTGNRYEWSKDYDLFSVKAHGDEIALCLEDWKALLAELPVIARKLGVEL